MSLGDFLKRSGHYLIGTAATVLSGLISYPLFTRVLEKSDYGAMGLIMVILLGGVAASKLGLQQSVVRMWSLHESEAASLVRTIASTMLVVGVAAAIIIGAAGLLGRGFLPEKLALPLAIAGLLVPIRAMYSLCQNLLRSRDKSLAYAAVALVNQFGGLAGAITAVTVLKLGLPGFYGAFVITEGLTVLAAMALVTRGLPGAPGKFNSKMLREGLHFGVPLIVFEFGVVLLATSDRFVLEAYWDLETVGLYTVAFNLAWQLQSLLVLPIELAALPMVSRLYDKEGRQAAEEFLAKAIRFFWMIAAPVVAGMWAVRKDLVVLLASDRYVEAATVAPVLLAGFLVFGARAFLAAGLFVTKKTLRMGTVAAIGAILNLGLNLLLVPRYGGEGSATATLIAQALIIVTLTVMARKELSFPIGFFALGRAMVGATGMALAVMAIPMRHGASSAKEAALHLVIRVGAGAIVYAAWVLATDGEVRGLIGRRLLRRA